ncbi:MAG: ATP-binding cassette domain-containing protein [Clostridiales bacterium]|nr:ATP-binding cassette domain-containing protein [Clostridiales bacterium]
MESSATTFTVEHLTFFYPGEQRPALRDISLSLPAGHFTLLIGPSGGGKTTLLRHFKSVLTPNGSRRGSVYFMGHPLETVDQRTQAARIAFVRQDPENQIVTDKVWHELAFGLESLGRGQADIRLKVAEMASFFGMEEWFHADTATLSGGQKQILNLAAALVMQPDVLLLDEPTSQLDPIAAGEFLSALLRVNRELGVAVVLSEQRLEEALPLADDLLVLEDGCLIAAGPPRRVAQYLKERRDPMFAALPTPLRVYAAVENKLDCPLTVGEGRQWLTELSLGRPLLPQPREKELTPAGEDLAELSEIWFRYEKESPDVLRGLELSLKKGEILAILGGNGAGKTTLLRLIRGLIKPVRGKIKIPEHSLPMALLPQNPQTLFTRPTVEEDLANMLKGGPEDGPRLAEVVRLCRLQGLLKRHPYDLSGGEQQRAALAKLLLAKPRLLLLDEPTKGLDAAFKRQLAKILRELTDGGVSVIMVSHDVEFCAAVATRCALLFAGEIISQGAVREFFAGHSFYTTAANRMARHLLPAAVTAEDIIAACGGEPPVWPEEPPPEEIPPEDSGPRLSPPKNVSSTEKTSGINLRTLLAFAPVILTIPLTIWFGLRFLENRRYLLISMLVLAEAMLPFLLLFEGRKPQARELTLLAVLTALAVASRAAFAMLPQFKPITAFVIISGVALGPEAGFLVGALSAFISNFLFGQGPWTPWQMFGLGLSGFLAGLLFYGRLPRIGRGALCLYGGLAAYFIYGALMNPASVIMFQEHPTREMFWLAYAQGLPFDIVHMLATVIFLWILGPPMLEKLARIKSKYGILKR